MSKRHSLVALRRRIAIVKDRMDADTALYQCLQRKASILSAEVAIEAMPEYMRNTLVYSGQSTCSVPRKPVVND